MSNVNSQDSHNNVLSSTVYLYYIHDTQLYVSCQFEDIIYCEDAYVNMFNTHSIMVCSLLSAAKCQQDKGDRSIWF